MSPATDRSKVVVRTTSPVAPNFTIKTSIKPRVQEMPLPLPSSPRENEPRSPKIQPGYIVPNTRKIWLAEDNHAIIRFGHGMDRLRVPRLGIVGWNQN